MASHAENLSAALSVAADSISESTQRVVSINLKLWVSKLHYLTLIFGLNFFLKCVLFLLVFTLTWYLERLLWDPCFRSMGCYFWRSYCIFAIYLWSKQVRIFIYRHLTSVFYIYDWNRSVSSVYQHLSSMSYFYRLRGLESPSYSPLVAMFLKGLKRQHLTISGPASRAKPMTVEILKKLYDYLNESPRSLRIWRTIWRIHLAFYCLLRWDDVCRLTVSLNYFSCYKFFVLI